MQTRLLVRRAAKRLRLDDLYDFVGTLKSPFHGVYDSWDEARRAIPEGRQAGYDHPEAASMYMEYTERLRLSDYAVLFWMESAIAASSSLFDLGGNVGLACYAFEKYLNYPKFLRWVVCDLPEISSFGKQLAQERNMTRLEFTENYQNADGTDILLTAGTLQCMETSLSTILSQLQNKPKHVLVNRLPLFDGKPFFTVRELPSVTLVYRVFNREEFVGSIEANGYQLIDSWEISEPSCGTCIIPFHWDKAIRAYSGLYFRLNHK
jgi:putative methyltransferase (TIGR04325 family)